MKPKRPRANQAASIRTALALLLAAILAAQIPVAPASAETDANPALPGPRAYTSAVWAGDAAYIFGGISGARLTPTFHDEIVRFDPATGSMDVMDARLPSGRSGTSAFWDGSHAYIIGGSSTLSTLLDEIVRYDPATDTLEVLSAALPYPRARTSVAYHDGVASIFGGTTGGPLYEERNIIRFDVAAGTVAASGQALPDFPHVWEELDETTAFHDGSNAYVYIPWDCSAYCGTGQFFQYHHETGTLTGIAPNAARLAKPIGAGVAWDGRFAYFAGGYHRGGHSTIVQAFEPATQTVYSTTFRMTSAAQGLSAIWDGSRVHAFGGHEGYTHRWTPWEYYDQVGSFEPKLPTDVTYLRAWQGVEAGQLILRWEPPADTGGFYVSSYRIYNVIGGTQTLEEQVSPAYSGLLENSLPAGSHTYRAAAVTPYGEGPHGAQATGSPATETHLLSHADVSLVQSIPIPSEARIINGGTVTWTRSAGTLPDDPRDSDTDGDCFSFRDIHWRFMDDGDTFTVRLLHDWDRVHVSFDDRLLRPCSYSVGHADGFEWVVPYRTSYYSATASGEVRLAFL